MPKKELLQKLRDIATRCNHDPEIAHAEAESALLAFIDDADVTAAFKAVKRWYS